MIALDLPPKPAIIQPAQPWEIGLDADMARRGLPRNIRRAIIKELRRVEGARKPLLRATADDLARFSGNAELKTVLGSLVVNPYRFGSAAPVLTYIGTTPLNSASATSTFNNVGIGSAAPDRYVIAIPGAYNNQANITVNSLTFDGNAGTEHVKIPGTGYASGSGIGGIYGLSLSTGTTSNIVVTWGGGIGYNAVLHIFIATDLASQTAVTNYAAFNGSSSAALSAPVNVLADGFVVAAYFVINTTLNAFTGVSTGAGVGGSDASLVLKGYCGSASNLAAQTPRTVQAQPAASGFHCLLSAAFR
jgi:hypothetical protein